MTVYYSLTFMLLAAEMITFCILVFPLPYGVRKRLFNFLSESPVVAKVAYGLKISFIFVGILFVDAIQRMYRVTAEAELAKRTAHSAHATSSETNIAARKFYAQRNTYLTGFCLFLSLVLTRTFYILLDLLHTQEEYAKLKQQTASRSRAEVGASSEVQELKQKLETKERDFETLQAEFDGLADKYNKATGANSDKRRD